MARRKEPGESKWERGRSPDGGELALIERIRRRTLAGARSGEIRLGIGDDCAILRPRAGEETVVTTDFSLEGRHFRRDWHPPESIGHRALARGLSDLAAMGARPVAAFLSLALPRSAASDAGWMDGFLDGLLRLADAARVPLAGGDTSEAPGEQVLIDMVLLGAVPAGKALRRSGARSGDRIFVTGVLGGAAAELQGLKAGFGEMRQGTQVASFVEERSKGRRRKFPAAPGDRSHPHLFPAPRLAAGKALLRTKLATAAIDLSDGISTDLRHLCEASEVAAVIDASALPLHPLLADFAPEVALDLALNGGEDYELLFTVRAKAKVPPRLGDVALTEIGVMEPVRGRGLVSLMDAQGRRADLLAGGWEHLR